MALPGKHPLPLTLLLLLSSLTLISSMCPALPPTLGHHDRDVCSPFPNNPTCVSFSKIKSHLFRLPPLHGQVLTCSKRPPEAFNPIKCAARGDGPSATHSSTGPFETCNPTFSSLFLYQTFPIPSLPIKRAAQDGVLPVNHSSASLNPEPSGDIFVDSVSKDLLTTPITNPLDGGSINTRSFLAIQLSFLRTRAVSAWKKLLLFPIPKSSMAIPNPPPAANHLNRENNPVRLTAVPNANLIRALSLTLVGKLLANQHPNFEQIRFQSARAFDCVGRISVNDHGRKLYSFEFLSQEDVDRVLDGGPWFVAGGLLLVERMRPRTPIEALEFLNTKIWARIHDLPPMGFNDEFGRGFGDALGRTCEVELPGDDARFHRIPNIRRYLRIKVELNIKRPIQRFQRLELEDGNGELVTFTLRLSYERLPEVCYYCGILSHHHDDCSRYDGAAPLLYGDWIRADRFFRLAPAIDDYVPWPELLIPDQLEQVANPIPHNPRRRMDPIPNDHVDQVNLQDQNQNPPGQQGGGVPQPTGLPAVSQPALITMVPPAMGQAEQSQSDTSSSLIQAQHRIMELQALLQTGPNIHQSGASQHGFLPFQGPTDYGWIQPNPFSAPAHLFPGLRPPKPPIAPISNGSDVLWYGNNLGLTSQAWYSPYHQQHPAFAMDRLYTTPVNQKNFDTSGIQPPSFSPFPSVVPGIRISEIDPSATSVCQTTGDEIHGAAAKAASLLAGMGETGDGSTKASVGQKRKPKNSAPSSRKSARGKEKVGEPKAPNSSQLNDDGDTTGGSGSNMPLI